eukprot:12880879-Prorocentrum_lima.AAC.1
MTPGGVVGSGTAVARAPPAKPPPSAKLPPKKLTYTQQLEANTSPYKGLQDLTGVETALPQRAT